MRTAFARLIFFAAVLGAAGVMPVHAEIRILGSPGGQVGPFLDLFDGFAPPAKRS